MAKIKTIDTPHTEAKDTTGEPPAPELLQVQPDVESVAASTPPVPTLRRRRVTRHPTHKATFIGLTVVVVILALNAVIITIVMRQKGGVAGTGANQSVVTLSSATLDTLGVSRNPVGNSGEELAIGPNTKFNGKVTVGNDVSIGGQLILNSKLSATDASLTNLQAGNTAVSQLNVNGDTTTSNLNLRKDLTVAGATRLQGAVTLGQLLTVNNNVNISGSLAIGGTLSVRSFQASEIISDTTLTIGGHMITRGSAPGVGPGSALGSYGTVSISGNDASGTVQVNIGAGGGGGILAQVAFRSSYSNTPHVVVTAVGSGANGVYVNRSAGGFSIGVNGSLAPGGYAFDYIVMQ